LYYTYADENGVITPGKYNYCTNYFNAMYSYWKGFVIVDEAKYDGSKLIVTEDTVKIKIKGGNIYLFDKNAAPVEPEQPEEPEQPAEPEVVAFTSATVAPADDNLNYHYITFTDGTYNAIIKLCTRGTTEYVAGLYDQNGSFSDATTLYIGGYTTDCTWNGAECWPVTMEVIDNGDGTATFNLVYNEYPSAVQHKGTYTGVLEGLTLVEPKQPEQPEQPEGDVTELTIESYGFGYMGSMETEVIFTDVDKHQHLIDFRMTGLTAGEYDGEDNGIVLDYSKWMYGSSDYNGGVVMDQAHGVITENENGTFTFDVSFTANGKQFHFVYTTPVE
jgi:hypothetical protein